MDPHEQRQLLDALVRRVQQDTRATGVSPSLAPILEAAAQAANHGIGVGPALAALQAALDAPADLSAQEPAAPAQESDAGGELEREPEE